MVQLVLVHALGLVHRAALAHQLHLELAEAHVAVAVDPDADLDGRLVARLQLAHDGVVAAQLQRAHRDGRAALVLEREGVLGAAGRAAHDDDVARFGPLDALAADLDAVDLDAVHRNRILDAETCLLGNRKHPIAY